MAKEDLRHTPLYDEHKNLGARLVDFAGYEMPIQYRGISAEHEAVRTRAGLFDVSHMGELEVRGAGALAAVNRLITNDLERASDGQALYTCACNERGTILDDLIVYRIDARQWLIVCNASNRDKIVSWLFQKAPQGDVRLGDESDELAQIALQGPRSPEVLRAVAPRAADTLKPRQCVETDVCGVPGVVSRTGYTGERGYELVVPNAAAVAVNAGPTADARRAVTVGAATIAPVWASVSSLSASTLRTTASRYGPWYVQRAAQPRQNSVVASSAASGSAR